MTRIFTCALVLLLTATSSAAGVSIQPYLDIRGQSAPAYAPDGTLAFTTSVTGVNQVWSIGPQSSFPVQLTYSAERAQFKLFTPSGKLLFGRDRGGNENTELLVANADGSDVRSLTPGEEKVRHNLGAVSEERDAIAYASNRRNPEFFDVYVASVKAATPSLVYQYDGVAEPVAFSHDGSKLLVSRSYSNFDNDLVLIDLQHRTNRLLTKHTGQARFECSAFSADDRSILCRSDEGRQFLGRADIRVANGTIRFLDSDTHDIDELAVSRDAKTEAYVTNIDGGGALTIADAITGRSEKRFLLTNAGVPSELTFDRDAKHLAYTYSGGNAPSQIMEIDVATGAERARTRASLAGLSRQSFVIPQLVSWRSFDGLRISGWLYKPRNAGAHFPVVIDIHGGPESQTRPTFASIDQYFVARGYAVLAPNVRGSTGFGRHYLHLADVRKREDSVKDIHAAYQWLVSKGADSKRVALYGGSYGGYMVLAGLTLFPDDFAAGVDIVGIGNWVTFLQNTSSYRRANREATYGSLERDRDFLASISPLTHVDRVKAPLLIFMGKNDPRVPASEGQQFADALKARNVPVELTIFPDEGHGIGRYANRITAYSQIAAFLDKYIGAGARTL